LVRALGGKFLDLYWENAIQEIDLSLDNRDALTKSLSSRRTQNILKTLCEYFEYTHSPSLLYTPKTIAVSQPNNATTLYLQVQTNLSVVGTTYQIENIPNGDVDGTPMVLSVWNNGTWENGIWLNGYWNDGEIRINSLRNFIQDLDSLLQGCSDPDMQGTFESP
jgi:hypothetical protein